MKDEFEVESELLEGGGGDFIVIADGQTIFSKNDVGRFPEDDEIVAALKALV